MEEILQLGKNYDFAETLDSLLDYALQRPDDFWLVAFFVVAGVLYDWARLIFVVIAFFMVLKSMKNTKNAKEYKILRKISKDIIDKF